MGPQQAFAIPCQMDKQQVCGAWRDLGRRRDSPGGGGGSAPGGAGGAGAGDWRRVREEAEDKELQALSHLGLERQLRQRWASKGRARGRAELFPRIAWEACTQPWLPRLEELVEVRLARTRH